MELKLRGRILSYYLLLVGILISSISIGCKEEAKPAPQPAKVQPVKIPRFNQDSAYSFIEKQLAFGYRVPGTQASRECRDWIASKLTGYGAKVQIQDFQASFLDQEVVTASNIIAEINPSNQNRVLLCAHYDSRLIAEKDTDIPDQSLPIAGADDGASGTAAIIEIARLLQENPIDLGVDIVFFDAEDQGVNDGDPQSWCLGSQYWARNPHKRNYKAEFGILLDMIAAKGAIFHKEGHSMTYAREYTDKIWKLAQAMGYGDLFQNRVIGGITDDHYYVNTVLGIPTVDIINTSGMVKGTTFGDYHHTSDDDIDVINKRNLKVVGQVVTAVVYKTFDRSFRSL